LVHEERFGMKREFEEESAIFASIAKWFLLATLTGTVIGLVSAGFLKVLNFSIRVMEGNHYYFLLLPAGLLISVFIRKMTGDETKGLGAEIEAVHKKSGKVKPRAVFLKLVATIVTVATGGSAGKEGPCAEIGAGISSILSDVLRLSKYDRKKLVICGISAGLAAVFGTPISGAVYGIEVLAVGSILYDVLMPAFVAGVTAYHVSSALGIQYFSYKITVVPVFAEAFVLKVVAAGLFFGLCSFLLIYSLRIGKGIADRIKLSEPFVAVIGGAVLAGLAFAVSPHYLGLGLTTTENVLRGGDIIWYAFLLKMIFTSVTFNSGGCGGIVTPIFFIGAAAGSLFAKIFGLDPATFAALGALSVMAGATTPP
jgi:Chloride channel protein EriC